MGLSSIAFLVASALVLALYLPASSAAPAVGDDLFLTPLIKSGDLDKARESAMDSMKLAKVESDKDVKSYSGYLTIDEAKNSNLFFWFFPAQNNPATAPVILWVNDVPGYTSLKGVFMETGPFYVDENNQLKERNASWTRTHSMLYIDAPVGSGFSFADNEDAFANNSDDEATEIYEALKQFFTLFKEFQPNDFYLAGENYAGTFMPTIGKRIDMENANGGLKINLKGLIMGSPYLDEVQMRKDDYYYTIGLISKAQKKELADATDKFFELHAQGKDKEAVEYGASLYLGPEALTAKLTGFQDTHSALTSMDPPELARFVKFVESKEVHNYLHTGVHKFIAVNNLVLKHFGTDVFKRHSDDVEELLNKGYRVLIYTGQFDILLTHDRLEEVVNNFKWDKSADFAAAPRKVWRVNGDVAGYAQSVGNFAYVLVRNAGNYVIQDQPEWTTDLVEKFIAGKDF